MKNFPAAVLDRVTHKIFERSLVVMSELFYCPGEPRHEFRDIVG